SLFPSGRKLKRPTMQHQPRFAEAWGLTFTTWEKRAISSAACERGLLRRRRVVRRRRGLAHLTKRARRLRAPRLHVLCEPWLADQQNAGPRALRIPAFEPDRADAGFVRFDGGKPHRGPARITHNRAVLIEHRCSPCVPPGPAHRFPKRLARMCKIAQ